MIMAKKGYNYPIKKKIPLILLLNLFGFFIISQLFCFVNIFREILSHYLPEVEKSLLLWEKGDHEVVDEELVSHKEHLIRHASRATFPHWGRLKLTRNP